MSFGRGANDCRLHELVFRVCSPMLLNNNPVIEIRRVGSNLFLDKHYFPILSLSTPPPMPMHSPASGDNQAGQGAFDVQIGFPDLQLFRNSKYFALLSYWLQDCDCNHSQCARTDDAPIPGRPLLPTRLIDVGQGDLITGRGSTTLRLIVTAAIPEDELKADARYIALSHPWGSNRDHDHFCTTRLNLDSRVKDGMAMDSLPATLRDAVVVTRALGVRYLWIDTICIIQGENGDFNTEAPLMETVFSLAHCVIAASSAGGTSSGFLSRQRSSRDFVTLSQKENHHGPDTNATLYIGEVIDNFQKHVIEGPLNKRGWVLQERALARRTIYFTQWQTYFECGAGIRCETLAKMTSNQAAFLGDPNFPSVALKSSKGARIRLYELLYKSYSALEFTNPCDRPIAIAGLEQRLVKAFNTHGGYGVFDGPFFGRGLLWKRDENVPRNVMRPIEVSLHKGSYYVPTWSWMAYEGVITFMDAPLDTVEWQHGTKDGLVSPWATLPEPGDTASPSASVIWHTGKTDEHTVLKAKAREFSVPLSKVETKIVYDAGETPRKDVGEVKCVIVGRQRMSESQPIPSTLLPHYVLVVGQRQKSDVRTEYERLGVAVLPGDWIDQGGGGKEIWIV
ncbi:heterokaryon incompatibility protein-domain-containing protein [Immersiella caudata]|uniref:Heterokaryon incompatibility protein-domain-containing protein n=1 Tax=Immersiella caudata TaxID=314043 RepID=A0AA39WQI0_9PEZI|nr:heterokaryon incompatibility protein-domain-containing protein [Immersiella caudata]